MEELIKWHPVSEPPKESGEYLCYGITPCENGEFSEKMYELYYSGASYRDGWNCAGIIITHWAELPNKPKEGILWKN